MKKSFTLLVLCAFVILHCATSNQGVKTMEGKGFVDKIKPIHISNVAYLDAKAGTSKI